MINLIVNYLNHPEQYWTVTHVVAGEITHKDFKVIEPAAEFLNSLGVDDDDIDTAIIEIYANNHRRACFDNGRFHHSEDH